MVLDPGEEGARIVKTQTDAGMFFELFEEWKIRMLEGLFEHMLEIAAGLVRVDQEDEMEILRHGDAGWLQ